MRPANHRITFLVVALLATLGIIALLTARHPAPPPASPSTTASASVTEPASKLRIVSIAPSVTEILFELGLGDQIVGATDYCTWPPAARQIPRVGGFGAPNLEKLLAAAPDLVIGTGRAPANISQALRDARIQVLELKDQKSFADIFDAFRAIGAATHTEDRASKVIARLQADLAAATERSRNIPPDKRPRVFIEIWDDPFTTGGGPSFLNEVIERAGGINVARELTQPFPAVNPEKVIEWNPDVIVIAHMAEKNQKELVKQRIGWDSIAAVKNNRVIDDLPQDYLLKPGPRLVQGVRMLAERLYPAQGNTNGPK